MNRVTNIEQTNNNYNNGIYIKKPSPGRFVLVEGRKKKVFFLIFVFSRDGTLSYC